MRMTGPSLARPQAGEAREKATSTMGAPRSRLTRRPMGLFKPATHDLPRRENNVDSQILPRKFAKNTGNRLLAVFFVMKKTANSLLALHSRANRTPLGA